MAFADPQSVTVNAVANALPRVSVGENRSSYSKDDGSLKMVVSHSYGKRARRQIRIDSTKNVSDPLIPANSVQASMAAFVVVDVPKFGFTVAEQKQIVDALVAYLSASSGAKITQLLGGEN